jgi:hypothetical protein
MMYKKRLASQGVSFDLTHPPPNPKDLGEERGYYRDLEIATQ